MARLHLFEFEDQAWCPGFIREMTTDFLLGLYNVFNIYEPAYAKIVDVIQHTHSNQIVDCCSGSGGPIKKLREHLDMAGQSSVTITLTDKYPNQHALTSLSDAFPKNIVSHLDSVDASQLPANLQGMRTFFSSFHHFQPDLALKILQDAVKQGAPIGIFESTRRHPVDFIRMLISPLLMLFIIPFAKKLTWRKFIFTYILPITPFTNMWDYFVSNVRTYSTQELKKMINKLDAPEYYWEIGQLWSSKGKCQVPYLIGYKR